ncbi:uncharacterized protein F5Z01DRAFT_256992 [Emericellopsis atlantica]|uniref:Uncharacterized protein n=1 Tax=Emericellopsis atlantica TaxID=2614577 RepID=A0A9P7ZHZ5_9HYPO|nr:uncharacterized protein F5Z01DRAFT_256992 [Emericellopsis atlantica]KAG9251915.1 hypothetical protein F5Z01DRAFT_256992 [Emericellopsis atlantica]
MMRGDTVFFFFSEREWSTRAPSEGIKSSYRSLQRKVLGSSVYSSSYTLCLYTSIPKELVSLYFSPSHPPHRTTTQFSHLHIPTHLFKMLFSTKTAIAIVAVLARATTSAADVVDDALASRSTGRSTGCGCPEGTVCYTYTIPGFGVPEVAAPGCKPANKKRQDSCGGCREGFECDDYAIGSSSPMCVPSSVKRQVDVAREMRQLRAVAEDVHKRQTVDQCGGCAEGQECVTVIVPGGPKIGTGMILEHRCGTPEEAQLRKRQLQAISADI